MLSLVITYLALILTIYFLPEKVWDGLFHYQKMTKLRLRKIQTLGKKQSSVFRAREFERYLIGIEARFIVGKFENRSTQNSHQLVTPQYGFYAELVDSLLDKYRQMGIPLKEILRELKINLAREIQFELKCEAISSNTYFQFFMMAFVTWGFIFFTNSMIDLSVSFLDYAIILMLQITGALFFIQLSKKLKQKHFKNFDLIIKKMYNFLTFLEVNASQSRSISESEILHLKDLADERFLPCAYRLEEAINKWKDLGLSPKNESQAVIAEVWNLKEQTFQVFIRQFEGLKFSILAFFYLPAYFYYLYAIFQFFMEQ